MSVSWTSYLESKNALQYTSLVPSESMAITSKVSKMTTLTSNSSAGFGSILYIVGAFSGGRLVGCISTQSFKTPYETAEDSW